MIRKGYRFIGAAVLIMALSSFRTPLNSEPVDFREEMRRFVMEISRYGKLRNPLFIIIPQNGQELLTRDGLATGEMVSDYIEAIDGVGREDLFYGYGKDNEKTPSEARAYMIPYLTMAREQGLEVLTIDYCESVEKVDDSIEKNRAYGFISFAADRRALDLIPSYPSRPVFVNDNPVLTLEEGKNFLFLINPAVYSRRNELISRLEGSAYDILIIDLFDNDGVILSSDEIDRLSRKPSGEPRLVLAYMSIGEAEDYRYYWNEEWNRNPPSWLGEENPHWPGNYKVRYWDSDWKKLIYGERESYLDLILESGFDGVYLDLIDAFEFFENSD